MSSRTSRRNRSGTSSRRQFMRTSAALAGMGFWVSTRRSFAADSKSPNERVNVGSIGVGGKGFSDMEQAGQFGQVVAICDVDDRHLGGAAEKFADAEQFYDYREMIDKMGDKVDAYTISTPDHNHAPAAMLAMKKGKHVYVQKPLTWSVAEARALRAAAKQYNVVTQMGNQGSAEDKLREGVEAIQSGVIGPVKEAHVWTNRPVWPQAPGIVARPTPSAPPPELHWDEWLGPAPKREFHASLHPFNWRGWWDFGTGALGDMWCHTANLAYRALKLEYPTSVWAEATELNPETYPAGAHCTWDFAEREGMPALVFHWYEGKQDNGKGEKYLPDKELFHGEPIADSGSLLVGEKGILYSPNDYGADWKLLPKDKFTTYAAPEKKLPRIGGGDHAMKKEWIDAIKGEGKTYSNFDYASPFTETALMGNIAIRLKGTKLQYNGAEMKFTNSEEANQFLSRKYREGWTL